MFTRRYTRRLSLALLLVLAMLMTACGGDVSTATSVPANPTATTAPVSANPTATTATDMATATTASSSGTSDLAGTVNFFSFSAAPDHVNDLNTMIAAFNKVYPNVKINVQTAAFADYFTKLQTEIAAGQAPDVFELNYENFVNYASKDTIKDLSATIAADKSFDPGVFNKRAYDAFALNGKQYGLSESFSDVVLFYNKDLFNAAGVALPTDDWTWNDALQAAHKLTDSSKGQWGLFKPTQFYEFYKTAYQFGCDFFNADKTATQINDPKCVDALTFMVNLSTKEHVMPTDAEMGGVGDDALFKSGKLAMWVNGIWQFAAMKDAPFSWDIAVEPGQVRKGVHFFSNAVVISKDSKNSDAAWAWLKFFTTSSEVAKTRIASSWELPALSDQSMVSDYLKVTPPANRQVVFKSLDYLVTVPVIAKESEMQDAVGKQLDKAKLGQSTPQQALDQAKQDVDALLK